MPAFTPWGPDRRREITASELTELLTFPIDWVTVTTGSCPRHYTASSATTPTTPQRPNRPGTLPNPPRR